MEIACEHLERKITSPKFASPSSGKQGISHAKSVSTRATTEDDWSGKHAQLRSTQSIATAGDRGFKKMQDRFDTQPSPVNKQGSLQRMEQQFQAFRS